MNKNKFALGAAIGAVAGVLAGILTAPKSGKETREDLKIKAAELKEETARRIEASKNTKRPIDAIKDQAEQAVTRGKELIKGSPDKK
jgi:gas vesicle protein